MVEAVLKLNQWRQSFHDFVIMENNNFWNFLRHSVPKYDIFIRL